MKGIDLMKDRYLKNITRALKRNQRINLSKSPKKKESTKTKEKMVI